MNSLLGNNPEKDNYNEKTRELRKDLLLWLKKSKFKHYEGVKARKSI